MSERHTRRGFMGLTSTAIAGAVSAPWYGATVAAAAGAEAGNADLVVTNAKVYTVDARMPRAEAFAVKHSRFIAVGSNDEIKGLAGKDTQDLRREADDHRARASPTATITPAATTLLYEVLVGNPFEVEFVTIASIIEKLRAKAQQTPPGHVGRRATSTTTPS